MHFGLYHVYTYIPELQDELQGIEGKEGRVQRERSKMKLETTRREHDNRSNNWTQL